MLTLTLNGNNIPLPVDFSMQLTWKSPVCAFDKIPGSYGLGITIPINEYTRRLFGFPERFAKYSGSTGLPTGIGNYQKYPGFEIRFGGVLLMAGTLTITASTGSAADGGNYEASLIDQVGVLGELEQERSILDIAKFSEPIDWIGSSNFNPDDYTHCAFPIMNHNFFTDKGVIIERMTAIPDPKRPGSMIVDIYKGELLTYLFSKTSQKMINKLHTAGFVNMIESTIDLFIITQKNNTCDAGKVSVITPFLYLGYVLKEALKDNNFHITKSFLKDDLNLKNLCIYNNYDITITDYTQTGEVLYQSIPENNPIPNIGEQIGGVDLNWTSSGKKTFSYIRSYVFEFTPKNHLPKMNVGELILSTQNLANVCFHFLPDSTVKILSREEIITGTSIDIDEFFLRTWAISEQKKVALNFTREHDSNDLVFADRFNSLNDRRADIKEPVFGWGEIWAIATPVEGEIRLMTSNNTYYEYRWISQSVQDKATLESDTTDVLGWEEISIGLQDGWFEFGRKEVEEIKTKWSSCLGNRQLTLVNQQGSMNAWKSKQQAFSPRLLISGPNNTGGTQNANFTFEYETDKIGILPKYWKSWNKFYANRLAVSGEFDLPVGVLRYVIDNICNKFRTNEGEFLIGEMSCELFIDRIGVTQIKGFKV